MSVEKSIESELVSAISRRPRPLVANTFIQIGILALPPKSKNGRSFDIYNRAQKTYRGLDATVIPEKTALIWVKEHINKIPLHT